MIISCPACQTKYNVPMQSIGAMGRIVKCTRCSNKWHAQNTQAEVKQTTSPKQPETSQQTVKQSPTAAYRAANNKQTEDSQFTRPNIEPERPYASSQAAFADNLPAVRDPQEQNISLFMGMFMGAIVAIALLGAGFLLKDPLFRAIPAIFSAFSTESSRSTATNKSTVDSAGLIIDKIERDILEEEGFTTYIIKGVVTNTNMANKEVPNLMVRLLDEHGAELDSWKVQPQKRTIQAGESTSWICYFYNPPLERISEYRVDYTAE